MITKTFTYIQSKKDNNETINLMYVCTHNSRRSHFGQVWAAVAAQFYGIAKVATFSGGTEATAFNQNAIEALKKIGFLITESGNKTNPDYQVSFGQNKSTTCFSKRYDDKSNPENDFAAIMTCGDAEANCPFIPGVKLRIATTYKDPKAFDSTILQDFKYSENCLQIATEVLYTFSLLK